MRILLLFALSPSISLGYLLFLLNIHLGDEDIEQLLNMIDTIEKTMEEIRGVLTRRFEIKKKETPVPNGTRVSDKGAILLNDIDVSGIQFKQKNGAIAEPYAKWGWSFAYTQNREYNEESQKLVQALEQYEKVQVGNRIYTLGGRDKNLINFKELDEIMGARANDGFS